MLVQKLLRPDTPGQNQHYAPHSFAQIESQGFEQFLEITGKGQGIMALSAHLGCFEILAAAYARLGVSLSIFGRRANYPTLADFVHEGRTEYGGQMIWREDPKGSHKIIRAIKDKRTFAALVDQDTALDSAFAPFFGLDAAHPVAPLHIALKFKLPIFFTYVVRLSPLRYHIRAIPIPYDSGDPDVLRNILSIFSSELQKAICRHPDQWLWWHRRWRRRPGVDYTANPGALLKTPLYVQWLKAQGLSKEIPVEPSL